MGVTMLPGAPQYGQGGGAESGGIVQLALAVKQQKMQEAEQKKRNAQETANMLMSNPQLLVLTDPKDTEKALKEGYGLKFNEKPPVDPHAPVPTVPAAQPQGGGGMGGGPVGSGGGVDPSSIAALGAATQGNKAGAQSGTPPSAGAANKAPGGGVSPAGNPALTEHLAATAMDRFNKQYGAMAPLYGAAYNSIQEQTLKAQTANEIETLKQHAAEGDFQSMGRLSLLAGKQVTDSDLRAMVLSSKTGEGGINPEIFNQALDYALGNETGSDKAKRFESTLKTLAGSPEFMGKLQNPTDITEIARSVVYGGRLPEGVGALRLDSISDLNAEAAYEQTLIKEVGLPYDAAHMIARARQHGLDISTALPKGMQTIAQSDARARTVQAGASALSAQAEMEKAKQTGRQIDASMHDKKHDILNERLKSMVEARKAKHPFPEEVETALVNEVAREAGLEPNETKKWYQWVTGGTTTEYIPIPDESLATKMAGAPQPKPSGVNPGSVLDNLKAAAKKFMDESNTARKP